MLSIKSLLVLSQTATFRHTSLTTFFTLINALLGAAFFILLARTLGPTNFGIVSVSIAFLTMVSDISNFGTDTGLINFVSRHLKTNVDKAYQYMKLGLIFKIVFSFVVVLVGFLLIPFIADRIFLKPELTIYLRLSLIGVFSLQLFSFVTNSLQAFQKYVSWGIVNISANLVRVLLLIFVILTLRNNPFDALSIYIAVPFFAFFFGMFFLPLNFLSAQGIQSVSREFFHYNKWIGFTVIIMAISSRIDTFMITRLLDIKEIGLYSVALQLTSIIPQFNFAIASVVAPKMASFDSLEKLKAYIHKLQLFVIGFSVIGLVGMVLGIFFIPIIYGNEYQPSIYPFVILFISQLIFLISTPWHQAIYYYFSKPKFFTIFSSIQLIINLILTFILVSYYNIIGAAVATLLVNIFGLIIPTIWVKNNLKSQKV